MLKVKANRARRVALAVVVPVAAIGFAVLPHSTGSRAPARVTAMSAECHMAYRGYMLASDPAESDFWAESWMTFGCESAGSGYWA